MEVIPRRTSINSKVTQDRIITSTDLFDQVNHLQRVSILLSHFTPPDTVLARTEEVINLYERLSVLCLYLCNTPHPSLTILPNNTYLKIPYFFFKIRILIHV